MKPPTPLVWLLILSAPAAAQTGARTLNFYDPMPGAEGAFAAEREHPWSFGASFRLSLVGGGNLVDGTVADFSYTDTHPLGWGFRLEGAYNCNEDPQDLNWGPYLSLTGDYFGGDDDTDAGVRLNPGSLDAYGLMLGLKVGSADPPPGGAFFWEAHGGIGLGHIGDINGTATVGGAVVATGNILDNALMGTGEIGVRLGYASDRWAAFGGIGWQPFFTPDEGSIGNDPDALHLIPIEIGFIYKF
jgi:hypothetical protein